MAYAWLPADGRPQIGIRLHQKVVLRRIFFVSQRLFELPIPLEGGFALRDEDQKSLFMTWLGEHGASVMKVARAYTLTSEECQDLAQEILLQAWRSLPNFEGKASPATWFYRVALHTAMNWHRKDKPRRSRQQPLLEVQAVATDGCEQCRASSASRNR